ncbi:MAG: phage tail protein [Polyangia bacterium]
MAITRNQRAYGVSKYGLEIEGGTVGWIKEFDGGHATAEVVTEKIGADPLARKHLGPLKYEEISFKCGSGQSKALYDWIQTGFNQTSNQAGRKSGAGIFCDYDQMELSRLTWQNGLITEFGMPALDASSKDAALMTLKFKPEITRKTFGGGAQIKTSFDSSKQKQWLPSNFRIKVDGCDDACKRVNKIEALTIKQKVTEEAVGEIRDYQQLPTSVEEPNLVLTLSESHADSFYQWHDDFVIKGNCSEGNEKHGQLDYLTPNLAETLFTLEFFHLGVFKISPDKVESGGEPVRRIKVEMYCEEIKFSYNPKFTFG